MDFFVFVELMKCGTLRFEIEIETKKVLHDTRLPTFAKLPALLPSPLRELESVSHCPWCRSPCAPTRLCDLCAPHHCSRLVLEC